MGASSDLLAEVAHSTDLLTALTAEELATVTGKVQKFVMRQVVEEQLGLKPDETA